VTIVDLRKTAALVLTILALATPGAAETTTVRGVVEAIDGGRLTVGGRRYVIERTTVLEDPGGGRVDRAEIRPGTAVELELDARGDLVRLQADLVR
jgi:hypothetical protein